MLQLCASSDFHAIYTIINDAAQRYNGIIPIDRYHQPYMPKEELQKEIDNGVLFWGAYHDTGLVGVMGIQSVEDVYLIRHAYVSSYQQGQGVGGKLIRHILKNTQGTILVGTWADAYWAIRFYEKHGFCLTDAEEKNRLLTRYWNVPDRQIETSVVLTYNAANSL